MLGGLLTALLLAPPELDGGEDTKPARFELDWEAPGECPDAARVRGRVDELLAAGPASAARGEAEAIVAKVRVEAEAGRFVARMRLRSGDSEGRRELGDHDCGELAEGVALIVALAVDPELMSRAPADEELEEPDQPGERGGPSTDGESEADEERRGEPGNDGDPPEPEPEPEPKPERDASEGPERPPGAAGDEAPPPAEPPPRLGGFGLVARGGAGFNTIAPASGRVGLAVAAYGRLWRAELGGSMWTPRRVDLGQFSIAAAELRGCLVPELASVELPVCAGVEAGAMTGVGRLEKGRRASAPWIAAVPGLGLRWVGPRDRLGVGLRVDAVLPLIRPAFASDEGRLILRAGFGAQVLAGIELRFPR